MNTITVAAPLTAKERKATYDRARYEANGERERARCRSYHQANREKGRVLYAANREVRLAYANAYAQENPHSRGAANARRRSPHSVPVWSDEEACNAIYIEARRLGLEVDHIVPLLHPLVCGLHVAANLQLMTKAANIAKGNTFTSG